MVIAIEEELDKHRLLGLSHYKTCHSKRKKNTVC